MFFLAIVMLNSSSSPPIEPTYIPTLNIPTGTPPHILSAMATIAERRRLTTTPANNISNNSPNVCIEWSQVKTTMEGQYKCVKGKVVSTYQAEKGTYIRFSNEATSFFFMYLYQGDIFFYYPNLKIGDCVQASGNIKTYQGIPRIDISGDLDQCE
jgi:hypothetical protein